MPGRDGSGLAAFTMSELHRQSERQESAPFEPGAISRLLAGEHRRLERLLELAAQGETEAYSEFRKLLLRHIGIEEKIVFVEAQRARSGAALPVAAQLRLEHGALAALVMLPPRSVTLRAIRAVLERHNPLEEGPGGVYAAAEEALGPRCPQVLEAIKAAPQVPVSPWAESPKIGAAARRTLARAGFSESLLDS